MISATRPDSLAVTALQLHCPSYGGELPARASADRTCSTVATCRRCRERWSCVVEPHRVGTGFRARVQLRQFMPSTALPPLSSPPPWR